MTTEIDQVRELLAKARRVVVLTGAGVSAESGVPTFRGQEGLWRNYDPLELATPQAFRRDPKLVWEWYNWRREKLARCKPNPAHFAIAEMEKRVEDFLLITQNVDGLHQLAGSQNIAEMHGCIWRVHPPGEPENQWEDRRTPLEPLPLRDASGNLLRPAVVWFGEMLPPAQLAKVESFFAGGVDLVLVAGTSALIGYIQHWAMQLRETGAHLVEINLEPTAITPLADRILLGKAGELLPQLIARE